MQHNGYSEVKTGEKAPKSISSSGQLEWEDAFEVRPRGQWRYL